MCSCVSYTRRIHEGTREGVRKGRPSGSTGRHTRGRWIHRVAHTASTLDEGEHPVSNRPTAVRAALTLAWEPEGGRTCCAESSLSISSSDSSCCDLHALNRASPFIPQNLRPRRVRNATEMLLAGSTLARGEPCHSIGVGSTVRRYGWRVPERESHSARLWSSVACDRGEMPGRAAPVAVADLLALGVRDATPLGAFVALHPRIRVRRGLRLAVNVVGANGRALAPGAHRLRHAARQRRSTPS